MQGFVIGLFWFFLGVGTFIGVALPYIFGGDSGIWTDQTTINCDRLDFLFYILSAFLLLCSLLFIPIVKRFDLGLCKVMEFDQPSETELERAERQRRRKNRNKRAPRINSASNSEPSSSS